MRFLTFNLWHGLSPSTTPLAFEALEPEARRKLREDLQIEVLRQTKADVSFFQEVNPVFTRAPDLAKALEMVQTFQPDLVGLKLFGLGIPYNLNSGLSIMAARQWGLKRVQALSLSRPGLNLVRAWGSWQLKEERFALYAETMIPKWGRVLLINCHLHHGLELTKQFNSAIELLGKELELPASMMSELKDRLAAANLRRAQELMVLLSELKKHESRYAAIILAGDFNSSPESELSAQLQAAGFRDAWSEAHPNGDPGFTFDSVANPANHLLQTRFPLTLVLEDLTFSTKVKEALLKLARAQENRPRRIDYLWFRAKSLNLRVRSAEMIGRPGADGLAPSDHFGVLANIEVEG